MSVQTRHKEGRKRQRKEVVSDTVQFWHGTKPKQYTSVCQTLQRPLTELIGTWLCISYTIEELLHNLWRSHTNHKGVIHAEVDSQQVDIGKGFGYRLQARVCLAPDLFNIYLDTVVCQLLRVLEHIGARVSTSFSCLGHVACTGRSEDTMIECLESSVKSSSRDLVLEEG